MGNETRLRIMLELASGPKSFNELKESMGATDGTLFYHLMNLGNSDLVKTERNSATIYSLTDKGRKAIQPYR